MKKRSQSEQRATYRVKASVEEAELFIATADGPVPAQIDDLSAQGCGFEAVPGEGYALVEGERITLRLSVGGPTMPTLFVRTVIRSVRDGADGVSKRCGVSFLDVDQFYSQMEIEQWRFFNRREAFRVPPIDERGRPLRARFSIPGEDRARSLKVLDLSSTGIATEFLPKNDVRFPKHLPVHVNFHLTGVQEEFDMKVLFVHRTKVDGRIITGFRFDPLRTRAIEAQTERILRHVLERQRQLLLSGSTRGA